MIEIPVVRPPETATSVPPLVKEGSLQGRIVGVSGRGDTVSVQLMDIDGHIYHCKAGKNLRRELAREAFDPTVRVHGQGKWIRDADGSWRVEEFKISRFEVLEDTPLAAVIGEIRALPGTWRNADDGLDFLQGLRSGESSP